MGLKKWTRQRFRRSKDDKASQAPTGTHPDPQQHAGVPAETTSNSEALNDSAIAPRPTSTIDLGSATPETSRTEPTQQPLPHGDSVRSIRKLWDVAYNDLLAEDESLVQQFENDIRGNLSAGIGTLMRPDIETKDWLRTILESKIEQVNRDSWKLQFGEKELQVEDVVKPVLAVVSWANDFVAKAVSSNPYASIAWGGVSLLLPLLLNPLEQAATLAKALEYISTIIVRSSMFEELYVRCYESKISEHSVNESIQKPHDIYRDALRGLYQRIIKFQIVCYRYFSHQTVSRVGLDAVKHNDWNELLQDVKDQEIGFEKVLSAWKDDLYIHELNQAQARHDQVMIHWRNIVTDVFELKREIEEHRRDEKREKVLSWLCTVDTSIQYNAARGKHRSGTCEWLIKDSEDFKTWETAPGSFLWLNGKAGSGKSILSSSVIKHLKEKSENDPRVALAYFFFSFGNLELQKVNTMLSSLVRQLCASRPDTPQQIKDFESYMLKGERPDTETLEKAIRAAVRGFSAAYIVVDALDECPILDGERARLTDCLNNITAQMPDNLHIFCTSRAEPDILTNFEEMLSTPTKKAISLKENQAGLKNDLNLHIEKTLATGTYKHWPPEIKDKAKELLIAKADGMFQYLVSQFEVLQNLNTKEAILSALQNLPAGLDATYDRLLLGLDPAFRPQILDTLKWLAFSRTPLRLSQLAEIFIFRPGAVNDLKEKRLFAPDGVLIYFSSLVTTETKWETSKTITYVRLAHFTVKEYLISDRIERSTAKEFRLKETNAHLHIAHSCLSYHVDQSVKAKEPVDELPLTSYAISNWVLHLDLVPREEWSAEVVQLAERALSMRSDSLELLTRSGAAQAGYRRVGPVSVYDKYFRYGGRYIKVNMHQRPYCYTAALGSWNLTKMLLRQGSRASMYLVQEDLNFTLKVAALGGHFEIVKGILERCVDDEERGAIIVGALQAAAYRGHEKIMSYLLESGADIDAKDDGFGSALKAAAMGRRPAALQLLVSCGADVRKAGCVLSCYISTYRKGDNITENAEVLQLLVDRGADINNKCARHGSPLNQAIRTWLAKDTRIPFDFVVQHGGDITLDDGRDGTPLQAACLTDSIRSLTFQGNESRSIGVVKTLLDMGADVNSQGGECGNALQMACREHEHPDGVIRLLVDRGAEINKLGGRYGTALHAACSMASPDTVDFLCGRGADVAIEGGEFGSVLQAAVSTVRRDTSVRLGIVQKLVEQGADVNATSDKFGSALQAAIVHGGYEDVETVLLRNGADVNIQGGIHGTALQAACSRGKMRPIRLLLSHGADVNVEGGKYGTALQAACAHQRQRKDSYDMARLLIDHGANIGLQGGLYGSAWHAAASIPYWSEQNNETLKLLLDHGIDVNSIAQPHGTALQVALETLETNHDGLLPRLRFLVEHGADINLGGGRYGFPLQSACVASNRHDWKVNICGLVYLLEKCPKINVNMTGGLYGTALQAATSQGKREAVELLLQKGADTNIHGGKYRTALNAAIFKGYWDLVEILLAAGAKPDCHQLSEVDEEWLESIGTKHGKGAVDRYRKFWEVNKLESSS